MAYDPYEGDGVGVLSIEQIQNFLQAENGLHPTLGQEQELKEAMEQLEQRFLKVKRWGPPYSDIELSPDIQLLMRKMKSLNADLMLQD